MPAPAALPVQAVEIVRAYPHDPDAFTEGLFWHRGRLYESTGLEGRSSIREVRLEDGRVLRRRDLSPDIFGEGIVQARGRLIALEYRSGRGTIWRLSDFAPLGRFRYKGEGWGLTSDGRRIIMSDGTAQLRFLDPVTLAETGRVRVTAEGRPVADLNELEWIDGEVWANVWRTALVARIDPASGRVKGWLDLRPLVAGIRGIEGRAETLNGIAWDARRRRLFLTGKFWPRLFEVRLGPPTTPGR